MASADASLFKKHKVSRDVAFKSKKKKDHKSRGDTASGHSKKGKEASGKGRKNRSLSELAELVSTGAIRIPQSLMAYVEDKSQLLDQIFTILGSDDIKEMLPDALKGCKVKHVKMLCYEQLKKMATEEIKAVLKQSADEDKRSTDAAPALGLDSTPHLSPSRYSDPECEQIAGMECGHTASMDCGPADDFSDVSESDQLSQEGTTVPSPQAEDRIEVMPNMSGDELDNELTQRDILGNTQKTIGSLLCSKDPPKSLQKLRPQATVRPAKGAREGVVPSVSPLHKHVMMSSLPSRSQRTSEGAQDMPPPVVGDIVIDTDTRPSSHSRDGLPSKGAQTTSDAPPIKNNSLLELRLSPQIPLSPLSRDLAMFASKLVPLREGTLTKAVVGVTPCAAMMEAPLEAPPITPRQPLITSENAPPTAPREAPSITSRNVPPIASVGAPVTPRNAPPITPIEAPTAPRNAPSIAPVEAPPTAPTSGVVVDSAQLVEMELRKRALESELKRTKMEDRPPSIPGNHGDHSDLESLEMKLRQRALLSLLARKEARPQ